jgi:hypothetical protein
MTSSFVCIERSALIVRIDVTGSLKLLDNRLYWSSATGYLGHRGLCSPLFRMRAAVGSMFRPPATAVAGERSVNAKRLRRAIALREKEATEES